MGDAYSYMSLMNEGKHNEHLRLYNEGKVIEDYRIIYLDGTDIPLAIYNITEVRIGKSSIRFLTEDGLYYIVSRDKIIFSQIYPSKDIGVIL
jgi:hypothetical protein